MRKTLRLCVKKTINKMRKTNKSIAGFHLLMILSAVDYKFHTNEEKVIRELVVHYKKVIHNTKKNRILY